MPTAKTPNAEERHKPRNKTRSEPKKSTESSSRSPKKSPGTSVLVSEILNNKKVPYWGPPWDHYNPVAWVTTEKGRNLLALQSKKATKR